MFYYTRYIHIFIIIIIFVKNHFILILGDDGRSPKEFLFVTAFVVPCLSIVICYARIYCIVRSAAIRAQQNDGGPLSGRQQSVIRRETAPLKRGKETILVYINNTIGLQLF